MRELAAQALTTTLVRTGASEASSSASAQLSTISATRKRKCRVGGWRSKSPVLSQNGTRHAMTTHPTHLTLLPKLLPSIAQDLLYTNSFGAQAQLPALPYLFCVCRLRCACSGLVSGRAVPCPACLVLPPQSRSRGTPTAQCWITGTAFKFPVWPKTRTRC